MKENIVFDTVVVIINVNTRISSTLALLSALRHLDCPVLLIDCSKEQVAYGRGYNLLCRITVADRFSPDKAAA